MAYNLPMQISLQKPDPGNVAEIKKSIETGLRYINLGAVTDTSIRAIKKTVRAANIGNVSVVLSGPSPTNLASIKKTIEASLSSINIGIDAKIAELNKVAKAISSASKSPGQQKELSPERAKNLNKKTNADIKRADKRGEAQVKKDLMQAAAIFKKSVSEAAARLEVALGKKQASVIVAKGVAKGKPASMLVESRGKADATRAVGDARAEVTRKRGDQKVIDDQKRADKQRVNDTKKSNAAIRRANRDQAARIAERNDPNSPANVRATARTTATVGTSNARTAAVNSKAAVDVQGKLAKDAATVAATNARAAATNVKATATVAATNARASATSIKAAATVAATNVKAAAAVGVANARAAATSQKGINDTAIANARAAAIAQRAADQTKKNEASIANLRSKSVSQINGINSSLEKGVKSGNRFFDAIAGKAQSFAAYAVASTAIIKLSGFVTSATEDAIKYEKELINISQTTGDSIEYTNTFSKSLEKISTKYNVTLSKTAQLARTLAQVGLSLKEATQATEILARTSLLAGFDDLTSTTEGFIAIMETFDLSVSQSGKALEAINTLSNKYAVESSDLVAAVSRTGGAFAAAGGKVEELLALITTVRSTTRESAETISTGFRTIFARLERPKTIEFFKKFNIELADLEGNIIDPFEAIQRINKGLEKLGITAGSVEFAKIAEEIGGIRQINKVIPLLTQAAKAQEALNYALDNSTSSIDAVEKAQKGLGYRLGSLQKEFAVLISETVGSGGFKILADIFINLSKSVMQFASTLKPLLSLLAPVAALLAGRAAGQALQGGGLKNAFGPNKDVRRRNKLERQRNTIAQGVPTQAANERVSAIDEQLAGITTLKRASGGPVPGSGSGDTVPAMLTPGEFVVNKKSAKSFGYNNLEKINGYANGGVVGYGGEATGTSKDLQRTVGPILNSMGEVRKTFDDILSNLGDMGAYLRATTKLRMVKSNAKTMGSFRASLQDDQPSLLDMKPGVAGENVLKHETGHAVDYGLAQKGSFTKKGPSVSEIKGTLQNFLAELLKPLVEKNLRSQGVSPGSHKNARGKDYFEYAMSEKEIFADLFASSDPMIQNILANITDVKEGSKLLAELFEKYPDRFKVMYAGIEENIQEIKAVKTKQAEEAQAQTQALASTPSGGLGYPFSPPVPPSKPTPVIGGMGHPSLPPSSTPPGIPVPPAPKTGGLGYPLPTVVPMPLTPPPKPSFAPTGGGLGFPGSTPTPPKPSPTPLAPPGGSGLGYPSLPLGPLNPPKNPATYGGLGYPAPPGPPPGPPVGPPVDAFVKGLNKATKAINKLPTFIESAVYAQTIASTVSTVSGKEINQGALTTGMTKGAMFSGAGDAVSAAMTRKNIFLTGKALEKLPGPFAKFGGSLVKNAGNIAIAGKLFAKGLNAASLVELGGGLFDSLFSTDYAKMRDRQIELGDSAGAAASAANAYAQAHIRGIPIIGGFLSALVDGMYAEEDQLTANGKLVVATARLAAEINKTSTETKKFQDSYNIAGRETDIGKRVEGQSNAVQGQLDLMDKLSQQSADLSTKRAASTGPSIEESVAKGAMVAGTGLLASAGTASTIVGIPVAAITAVGSLVAGIATGAYDYYSQLTMSTEEIVKSYEVEGKKLQQAGEIQAQLIDDLGTRIKNASISSLRAGGSGYKDAIDNVTKEYGGKDKLTQAAGGFELSGNLEKDRQVLGIMAEEAKKQVTASEKDLGKIKPSDLKGLAAQQLIVTANTEFEKLVLKLKGVADETYYATEAEKILIQRRKVAAESMAYQIQIMKQLEYAFDGLNSKFADFNNIAEELGNVGTGRLSSRQAASRAGINSQLLETNAKDIMRDPVLAMRASDSATAAGAQTKDAPEIANALKRMRAIDAMGQLAKNQELGKLLAPEGEKATDPKELASIIQTKLETQGFDIEGDKMMKEAIMVYADTISKGYEYAGAAENEAREKASEEAIKIIEKLQEAQNKVIDAEKKLRDGQIELINRQLENAKAVYDAEKSYFDERLSLNQKVSDALQTEPVGPKKAGFLGQKALATRNSQMAALSARTGGANIGQSINANTNRLNVLRNTNDKKGTNDVEITRLKGNLELLSKAVRDQIDIENQYLDGLIDMAKAQQEYTQSLYDAQGSIVRDLVTGTDEDVGQQLTTLNAAAIASQQGSFAGIPETLKKGVFSLFDQFGDVTIPGLGKTGRDAQREITKNEMMKKFGVDSATAEQLASKAVNDKVPIDQRMAVQIENQRKIVDQLMYEEHGLKLSQIADEVANTALFGQHVDRLGITLNDMINEMKLIRPPAGGPANAAPNANQIFTPPQNNNAAPAQQVVKIDSNGQQAITVTLAGIQSMTNNAITALVYEQVSERFRNLSQEVRTANNFEDVSNALANAATKTQTVEMGAV